MLKVSSTPAMLSVAPDDSCRPLIVTVPLALLLTVYVPGSVIEASSPESGTAPPNQFPPVPKSPFAPLPFVSFAFQEITAMTHHPLHLLGGRKAMCRPRRAPLTPAAGAVGVNGPVPVVRN
jgi:hypothetical protein